MKTSARPGLIRITAVGVFILGVGLSLVWLLNGESPQAPVLVLIRENPVSEDTGEGQMPPNPSLVVPDFLRRKYEPRVRAVFWVSSTEDVAIFVDATGVQVPSQWAWRTEAEDHRGEIWRLKAGTAREVCVGRPASGVWRTYVRYGTELKGLQLLKAQMREAWLRRSFSNWTGKAWGGGRFGGSRELFSEEITE